MTFDRMNRYRVGDVVLLACVAALAVATWAAIVRTDGVAAWKHCIAVSVTMFVALAAVTPHETWAVSVRLAMSGWLMTAPWLLGLAQVPAVRWAYLISGALIALLCMPAFLCRGNDGRSQHASPFKFAPDSTGAFI